MGAQFQLAVIGNYVRDRQWSMLQFARIVSAAMTERGVAVHLVSPQERWARLAPASGFWAKWLGYADKYLVFPRQLRQRLGSLSHGRRESLLVHICDHSNSLYVDQLGGLPHVVTCHDLIAVRQARGEMPGPPVRWTGRKLQQRILTGLRKADWVACDSHSTRRDVLACAGRPPERTETIHCQMNEPYRPMVPDEAWRTLGNVLPQEPGALLLHVGNNSWYKNRDGVLRVFAEVRRRMSSAGMRLLVVGREFTAEQDAFITRESLKGVVRQVADLSAERIQAAYSVANAFLFPSHYEGFGWPPLEAQACGCPVVAGTGGSLAEILADSALTAAAADEQTLTEHVLRVLSDPGERERLRALGFANVRRFQPPVMMEKYLELYERILARGLVN